MKTCVRYIVITDAKLMVFNSLSESSGKKTCFFCLNGFRDYNITYHPKGVCPCQYRKATMDAVKEQKNLYDMYKVRSQFECEKYVHLNEPGLGKLLSEQRQTFSLFNMTSRSD